MEVVDEGHLDEFVAVRLDGDMVPLGIPPDPGRGAVEDGGNFGEGLTLLAQGGDTFNLSFGVLHNTLLVKWDGWGKKLAMKGVKVRQSKANRPV